MNRTLKSVLVLVLITGISGASLTALNQITAPIIEENRIRKAEELYNLFDIGEYSSYEKVEVPGYIGYFVINFLDEQGNPTGSTLYEGYSKNSYGDISLLAQVVDGIIIKFEYLSFNQSYSQGAPYGQDTYHGMSLNDLEDDYDTATGATYSTKSINDILQNIIVISEGGAE